MFRGSSSHSTIGFVVQQGCAPKTKSPKRFFSKETFPWPGTDKYCVHLVDNQIAWLVSTADPKKESPLELNGSNLPLFFGFYIKSQRLKSQHDPKSVKLFPKICFKVSSFGAVAEYVDHELEESMKDSEMYLPSRLVPGLTCFTHDGTEEKPVFHGFSLEGEIQDKYSRTLPADKWKVDPSTYPPRPFYDAEEFKDNDLIHAIFGKRPQCLSFQGKPILNETELLCNRLIPFFSHYSDPSTPMDHHLLILVKRLKEMTIRNVPLYDLLRRLAFRDGIAYPLAITGGSVRDALQNKFKDMKDIDIVVGGTYDELCYYLRDLLALLKTGSG